MFISDNVYDSGLAYATANGTTLHITTVDPAGDYATVTGNSLGTAAVTVGSPVDGDFGGRKVVVAGISGSIAVTGTATHWALTDGIGEVIASGALSTSVSVESGYGFGLGDIAIAIKGGG